MLKSRALTTIKAIRIVTVRNNGDRPMLPDPIRQLLNAPFLLKTLLISIFGGFLVWQIGSTSIASVAARSSYPPLLQFFGSAEHPPAGAAAAQAMLLAGDAASASRLARDVVVADPTNDRALRVLALATEQLGDDAASSAIMRKAGTLGWRDTPTQLWLLNDAIMRDDFDSVLQHADALARRNRSGDFVRGIFLASVTEPRLRLALVKRLEQQPRWRGIFFADVRQRLPETSVASMAALFDDMEARGHTIAPLEWLSYIDRLIDLERFEQARTTWASAFEIPRASLSSVPFDPAFSFAAQRRDGDIRTQFEWVPNPDLLGTLFDDDADGRTYLIIPPGLETGTVIVSQLVMLSPGLRTVVTQMNGSGEKAPAGWNLRCLPSEQVVPRRIALGTSDELSQISFEVPSERCAAQRLELVARDMFDAKQVGLRRISIR